jgi:hypothetical protein
MMQVHAPAPRLHMGTTNGRSPADPRRARSPAQRWPPRPPHQTRWLTPAPASPTARTQRRPDRLYGRWGKRWRPPGWGPAPARRPADSKSGSRDALPPGDACGDLRKVATKCVIRCLTGWCGLPPGTWSESPARSRSRNQMSPAKSIRVAGESQECIRGSEGAPGRLTSSVPGKESS